jgi:hypothetical protein
MTGPDKFHGQGGTFIVNAQGERERARDVHGKEIKPGEPHPEGDRARDADGKAIDEKLEAKAPAIPAPAHKAPWAANKDEAPAAAAEPGPGSRRKGKGD